MLSFYKYYLMDETIQYDPSILRPGVKRVKYNDNETVMFNDLISLLGGEDNIALLEIEDMSFSEDDNFVNMKYRVIYEGDYRRTSRVRINRLYSDDDDYWFLKKCGDRRATLFLHKSPVQLDIHLKFIIRWGILEKKLNLCYNMYRWCIILVTPFFYEGGAKNPLKGHIVEVSC